MNTPLATQLRRHRPGREWSGCGAWTLVETIGAMAIAALVLGLLLPALHIEMERKAREAEERQLTRIVQDARDQIRRSGRIPAPEGFASWLAELGSLRAADVLTNARSVRRAWVTDPRWRLGEAPGSPLPWIQGPAGSVEPVGVRAVLLSSLGEALPDAVVSGGALSEAEFDAVWNRTPGSIPAGWAWPGQAADLLEERVDFADGFVPVVVSNPELASPRLALSNQVWTVGAVRTEAWYLKGTALELQDDEGRPQLVEILGSAASWQYAGGRWRRLGAWNALPEVPTGREFSERAERFLTAPTPPGVDAGVTERLLAAMDRLANSYAQWAESGFPGPLDEGAEPVQSWLEIRRCTVELMAEP